MEDVEHPLTEAVYKPKFAKTPEERQRLTYEEEIDQIMMKGRRSFGLVFKRKLVENILRGRGFPINEIAKISTERLMTHSLYFNDRMEALLKVLQVHLKFQKHEMKSIDINMRVAEGREGKEWLMWVETSSETFCFQVFS